MSIFKPTEDTIIETSKKILDVEKELRNQNRTSNISKTGVKKIYDIIDGVIEDDYQTNSF